MAGAPFWGNAAHEGPLYSANPFKLVIFDDGFKLPGECDVKGLAQLEIENKKGKGQHGSAITVSGYQPGPFEVTCMVWTEEQWVRLQLALDLLWNIPRNSKTEDITRTTKTVDQIRPTSTIVGTNADGTPIFATTTVKILQITETRKPNRKPIAHQIYHPWTHVMNIPTCVIQGVSFPEWSSSFEGAVEVKFKCVEHAKPDGRKATKTADGTGVTVDPTFASGIKPKNATPAKPSTVKAARSPKGQPPEPGGGTD